MPMEEKRVLHINHNRSASTNSGLSCGHSTLAMSVVIVCLTKVVGVVP
jgi:hypothetical protein